MTQWIQTIPTLRQLDLADSRVPADVLRSLIAGMSANPMLVELVRPLAICVCVCVCVCVCGSE
jgi:hypothetical protein